MYGIAVWTMLQAITLSLSVVHDKRTSSVRKRVLCEEKKKYIYIYIYMGLERGRGTSFVVWCYMASVWW